MKNRSRKPIPKRLTGRLTTLVVVAILMLALLAGAAGATSPGGFAGVPSSSSVLTSIAGSPAGGVWVQQDDTPIGAPAAGTYTYGEANAFTSIKEAGVIAAVPGRAPGYGAYHIVAGTAPVGAGTCGYAALRGEAVVVLGFPVQPKGQRADRCRRRHPLRSRPLGGRARWQSVDGGRHDLRRRRAARQERANRDLRHAVGQGLHDRPLRRRRLHLRRRQTLVGLASGRTSVGACRSSCGCRELVEHGEFADAGCWGQGG